MSVFYSLLHTVCCIDMQIPCNLLIRRGSFAAPFVPQTGCEWNIWRLLIRGYLEMNVRGFLNISIYRGYWSNTGSWNYSIARGGWVKAPLERLSIFSHAFVIYSVYVMLFFIWVNLKLDFLPCVCDTKCSYTFPNKFKFWKTRHYINVEFIPCYW